MNRIKILLITPALILSIVSACSREEENSFPEIQVNEPVNGTSVSHSDSLYIDAFISDDKLIESIKVVLTNNNYIPASKAFYFYPNSATYHLTMHYPVEGNNVSSGTYYLLIRADDGTDFSNAYIQIHINTIPSGPPTLLVITRPDANHITLYKEDNSGNIQNWYTIEGDYADSEINPSTGAIYFAGSHAYNLRAYDPGMQQLLWEKEDVLWNPMHNANCLYSDENVYVTFYSDYIKAFKPSGNILYTILTEQQESPEEIFVFGNHLFVDMQKKDISTPEMIMYNVETGLEKQRVLTTFDVVAFHASIDESLLITSNAEGLGRVSQYFTNTNFLNIKLQLGTTILSSVSINSSTLLIGTTDGLLSYNALTNSSHVLIPGIDAEHLLYDEISGRICFSANGNVYLYTYPEMENQKMFPFSDSILNLHLQFQEN